MKWQKLTCFNISLATDFTIWKIASDFHLTEGNLYFGKAFILVILLLNWPKISGALGCIIVTGK